MKILLTYENFLTSLFGNGFLKMEEEELVTKLNTFFGENINSFLDEGSYRRFAEGHRQINSRVFRNRLGSDLYFVNQMKDLDISKRMVKHKTNWYKILTSVQEDTVYIVFDGEPEDVCMKSLFMNLIDKHIELHGGSVMDSKYNDLRRLVCQTVIITE